MALRFGGLLREARLLLVFLSLALAVIGAVAILLSVVSPVRAQEDPLRRTPVVKTGIGRRYRERRGRTRITAPT
jgi:hypothetical protein